ncbi:2-deoxy-5-keto-D-gluconate 6-phosphate aldolase domain-containing protein [Leifsonia poae]|uniref:2-deoxy-5-keto-D-gluconate 6-phosphate aldolase domain-containing protein n=1 Tax=Leifsonia poae TaxID=110933 RepID=UPI003D6644D4
MATTSGADAPLPEASHPLLILAMDHRDSLAKKVYGIPEEPTPEQASAISDGKMLVFEGAAAAVADLPAEGRAGLLVDERYGSAVARSARGSGFALIMPIERSGRDFFELEYGGFGSSEWLDHVDAFDPDYVKVLIRDNPAFAPDARHAQQQHLAQVGAALASAGRRLIVELLVPATGPESDLPADRFDAEVRPALTDQLIREFHAAGAEPDIWKLEGFDSTESAAQVAATAREGGRDDVRCIVLGRDASAHQLDAWLTAAAPAPGFAGFAIGRSIWEKPLEDRLAGRITEDAMRGEVARAYVHYAKTYTTRAGHT